MHVNRSIALSLLIAAGAVGCHHDTNATPANAGSISTPGTDPAVSGANGPATSGGASTTNSTYGGNTGAGSTPGDQYTNQGVDPATGIGNDAGVMSNTTVKRP
jgi:hypothetical protein